MADKPRPKHFEVIDKINKKIADSFTPAKNKEDKAKFKAAQDADPKFQEWKKKRPLKEKVESAIVKARSFLEESND